MSIPEKENAKAKGKLEKILKISIPCVLAIGFLGSILGVILASPELKNDDEGTNVTKGLLRVNQAEYRTQYFAGEHFSFNKETALVTLVAKDPLIEGIVKVDNLPAPEYGFVVGKTIDENGNFVSENDLVATNALDQTPTSEEGSSQEEISSSETHKYTTTYSDFVLDPTEITMEKNMGTIYLVSKRYSDLRYPLSTKVYSALTEDNLSNDVQIEAEDADLYQDGKFLSYEDKVSKSFLSNVGTNPLSEEQAAKLSGGVCLRNFNSNNMKVDFIVPASKDCEVTIEVNFCTRPKGGVFSNFFQVSVNDETCDAINNQNVPNGEEKQYFNPTKLVPVTIALKEGFNHITFVSGTKVGTGSPFNLDAIHLTAADNCINSLAALA